MFKVLGLTGFDARVYSTLLTQGPMTTNQLVEALHVHRPQLHESLSRLQNKGLVETSQGRPAFIRAAPPNVLIGLFREELGALVRSIEEALKNVKTSPQTGEHGVWFLKSWNGLRERFKWAIEKARVDLAVSGDLGFIRRLRELLLEAKGRGVTVYVMVYGLPDESPGREEFRGFDKVKRSVSGDMLVVADSQTAVIAQRRMGARRAPRYGLVVEEPVLIDHILHNYYHRWVRSASIVDDPVRLPARFTVFRLALLEAERLLNSGVKLWGVFSGRRLEGGRARVEGEVIEAFVDPVTGISQFVVKSGGRRVTVGGPDAIIEDLAADEIILDRV